MPFNLLACSPLERGAKHRYRAAIAKWSRARIDDRIDELMALLGLESNLRERYPHQLSGGQSNVWSGARTAADPQVLLMDEPFGALDPVTRRVATRDDAHSPFCWAHYCAGHS